MSHQFLIYDDKKLSTLKHTARLFIQEGFHKDNIYETLECSDKRLSTSGNNTVACFTFDFENKAKTFNNEKTQNFLEAIYELNINPMWIKFC